MRKLIPVVAVVALCACSQKTDEGPAPGESAATADPAVPAAPAGWTGFEPGAYVVTASDGAKADYLLKDDGTFTMTNSAGKATPGTLSMKDGQGCFTHAGGTEMCWTNSPPGADGSWVATATDGTTGKVVKKAATP